MLAFLVDPFYGAVLLGLAQVVGNFSGVQTAALDECGGIDPLGDSGIAFVDGDGA